MWIVSIQAALYLTWLLVSDGPLFLNFLRPKGHLPLHSVEMLDYNELTKGYDYSVEIERAFGPNGLGILTVSNVPRLEELRAALLPLARKISLLSDTAITKLEVPDSFYSSGWSHGKERLQGKPDNAKGSFYANPLYDSITEDKDLIKKYPGFAYPNVWPKKDLPALEPAFKALGTLVIDVGRLVANQSDNYVKRQRPTYDGSTLSRTVADSVCVKARLLHYFAHSGSTLPKAEEESEEDSFSNWCGWHNDHGSLTGLVSGMFLDTEGNQVPNQDPKAGLYIRSRNSELIKVNIPPNNLAFQIGEASQLQSGGAIQATPHAVRGSNVPDVSRESFAVFMEPCWDDKMDAPPGVTIEAAQSQSAAANLPKGVPSLRSRWEMGMTFGEFADRTLKSYY